MLKKIVIAAVAVSALGSNAFAGTATISQQGGTLNVSASIVPSCTAAQGSPVGFGNITSLASPVAAQGTIQVTCDNGVDFAIGLGGGQNLAGAQRRMSQTTLAGGAFTTFYLPYELYADIGHSTPITDIAVGAGGSTTGSPTAPTPGGTGTGLSQTITVYGQVPAGTKPWPGNYNDNVTITVGY
jgi:spore coat protein U-like protein